MPSRCIICKVPSDKSLKRAMHRFPNDKNLRQAWIDALWLTEDLILVPNIYLCSNHFQENDFNVHLSGARTLKPDAVPSKTCMSGSSIRTKMSSPVLTSSNSSVLCSCILPNISRESISPAITFNKPLRRPIKRQIKDQSSSSAATASDTLSMEEQKNISDSISPLEVPKKYSSKTITASETGETYKQRKSRKRKRLAYIGDITIDDLNSSRRAAVCFNPAKSKIIEQQKRIQNVLRSNRRLKSKVTDLKLLLSHLREKNYITEYAETTIIEFAGSSSGSRGTPSPSAAFHSPSRPLFKISVLEKGPYAEMDGNVEHELCANCKKEIPQHNYVMHTMHCARNISLCKTCKEPIPKNQFEDHSKSCKPKPVKKPSPPPTLLEKSSYFQQRKAVEDQKALNRRETYLKKHDRLVDTGFTLNESVRRSVSMEPSSVSSSSARALVNGERKVETKKETPQPVNSTGAKPKTSSGMLACKYCDLELPKLDLEDHENYCGTRTDKCLECGELVMFKNKQVHLDSNHGFVKLKDEPGPRPSWDSTTQRSTSSYTTHRSSSFSSPLDSPTRRRSFRPTYTDFDYDPMPYLPSTYQPNGGIPKKKEGESYKEISRRLDCKTEYIRNLLHDSASITVPLRHNGVTPRNHFNHNKGPAPQPPRPSRRRNPPTELVIPCEFCNVPVPHDDLIEHETGCRPDLARYNPRRNMAPEEDDYFTAPRPSSPEAELPCEFCADMIPASQLLRHQLTCSPA